MTDSEIRVKRAIYRANHRGTKELDIILGRYANAEIDRFDETELTGFEQFLALPDPQIDAWIKGDTPPDNFTGLVRKIRKFHGMGA